MDWNKEQEAMLAMMERIVRDSGFSHEAARRVAEDVYEANRDTLLTRAGAEKVIADLDDRINATV